MNLPHKSAIDEPQGCQERFDIRATDVRASVDQTLNVSAVGGVRVEAESDWERKVRTVAALLIPTLDSSANGAGDDCQVERSRNFPFVADLSLEDGDLLGAELLLATDLFVVVWVLSNECALLQVVGVLGDALLSSKLLNLSHKLVLWDASERVLDLCLDICNKVRLLYSGTVVVALLRMRVSRVLRPPCTVNTNTWIFSDDFATRWLLTSRQAQCPKASPRPPWRPFVKGLWKVDCDFAQ